MTVYALMVEESVEGESVFMVRSLHSTYESANEEGKRLYKSTWYYYVDPMEVLA